MTELNHADTAQTQQPQRTNSYGEKLLQNGKIMSLWGHLDELRTRIVRAGITILVCFAIALAFSNRIINFLKVPLVAVLPPGTSALHFTGPMDVFTVNIKVAFLVSVVLGAPAWLYQFWKFLEPALYPTERKYVMPFIVATIGCFLTGVAFCYYFMIPMALHYLIGIGLEVGTPIITITDYISLITVMILGFGLVFETPVILVLLAMLNLITADALAAQRRITFVVILILSAIITPPDPISMMGMAIPCYMMFEISILIIRMIKGRQPRDVDSGS